MTRIQIGMSQLTMRHLLVNILFMVVSHCLLAAAAKRCTYTFTVTGKDAQVCGTNSNEIPAASPNAIDYTAENNRLLETVTRILAKQVNDEGEEDKMTIKAIQEELDKQRADQKLLKMKINDLHKEMQMMLADQHSVKSDTEKLFETFNGITNRFLGCPQKSSKRIHEITPLKKQFEQLIKLVPRSCLEWKQRGYWAKGLYMIDPDGLDGEGPFEVECIMSTDPITVIHHDKENRTQVHGFDDPGSYVVDVTYTVSDENLKALIKMSTKCEQFLKWECKGASLSHYTWWVNPRGERMSNWGGGGKNGCHCYLTNNCNGGNLCNCDQNIEYWSEDSGYLSDKDNLPVSQMRYGDTGNYNEEGFYTLGPLHCYSNITSPFEESSALLPVQVYPSFNVFCNYDGWLVIQRNTLGSPLSWDRDWEDYKNGFGDLHGDFWLGLEKMYELTNQGHTYTLQIDMVDQNGIEMYSQYSDFKIYSETYKYLLQLGAHSGTIEDQLYANNGMQFTTPDDDNDRWDGNCSELPRVGGWWYADCGHVTLNGPDIKWGSSTAMKATEMKIILTRDLING